MSEMNDSDFSCLDQPKTFQVMSQIMSERKQYLYFRKAKFGLTCVTIMDAKSSSFYKPNLHATRKEGDLGGVSIRFVSVQYKVL